MLELEISSRYSNKVHEAVSGYSRAWLAEYVTEVKNGFIVVCSRVINSNWLFS